MTQYWRLSTHDVRALRIWYERIKGIRRLWLNHLSLLRCLPVIDRIDRDEDKGEVKITT